MWPSKYCWIKCTISEQVRFICLSIYLSTLQSVRPSKHSSRPSVRASFSPPILLCVRPFVHWPVPLCVSPFFYPSVRASSVLRPSFCGSVLLSTGQSVRASVSSSIRLSVRPWVRPSLARPSSPFIFSSVLSSLRQSVCSSTFPSVPPVRPCIHPFFHLSICAPVPLYTVPSVRASVPWSMGLSVRASGPSSIRFYVGASVHSIHTSFCPTSLRHSICSSSHPSTNSYNRSIANFPFSLSLELLQPSDLPSSSWVCTLVEIIF